MWYVGSEWGQKKEPLEESIIKSLKKHGFVVLEEPGPHTREAMAERRKNPLSVAVFELGWSAAVETDTYDNIEKRGADANYHAVSFIGALLGEDF